MAKTSLRSRVNRFFFKNRNRGISNLMLYIAIGNVVVYVIGLLNPENPLLYLVLRFDYLSILKGQVWRLFTFPLCYLMETGSILGFLSLLFYYWCGRILDQYWGALRFNFYYLGGMVLIDVVGMAVCAVAGPIQSVFVSFYVNAAYLNMSLLLAVATLIPEEQVRIWFVLPVKMKWLAWIDLGFTLYGMIRTVISPLFGGWFYLVLLFPLVPIANYLLFFGKQAAAILPDFLRYHPTRKSWKRKVKQGRIYEDIPRARDNARFRCTVCGRTELTDPKLEFRYCSKCAGYRCYCADHINNHTHITE